MSGTNWSAVTTVTATIATTVAAIATAYTAWIANSTLKVTNESLKATKEQVQIANRQNELDVYPFVTPFVEWSKDEDSIGIRNITNNPALNIYILVATQDDNGNIQYASHGEVEYLSASDRYKGERVFPLGEFEKYNSKDELKEGLVGFYSKYGKDAENTIRELIKTKLKDDEMGVYVFYLDFNRKVHVAIKDIRFNKENKIETYTRKGHLP